MSFSTEQKSEVIATPLKASCCKRAMLQGMIAARGEISDGITVSVESPDVIAHLSALIKEVYSQTPAVFPSSTGGRRRLVAFHSPKALEYLGSFRRGDTFFAQKCPICREAFLRGVFLVSGRVSDPTKQYLLEFSVGNSTDRLFEYFSCELGLTPRVSKKPKETLIYFKRSSEIEDFFALAGMNSTAFAFMNAKINGEIRNNVNRVTNCTTNNIDKAVTASMQQIALIEELIKRGLISQLPEELEATARLRVEHRDLSLAQLAALTSPRISKSGLSHRLKKITEIAKSLLDVGIDGV